MTRQTQPDSIWRQISTIGCNFIDAANQVLWAHQNERDDAANGRSPSEEEPSPAEVRADSIYHIIAAKRELEHWLRTNTTAARTPADHPMGAGRSADKPPSALTF